MNPTEHLLERLKAMGLQVPQGAEIRRTYVGRWQRAAGAWSWCVHPTAGSAGIGSHYPVTALLRTRLVASCDGDWHIFPASDVGDVPDEGGAFTGRLALRYLAEPVRKTAGMTPSKGTMPRSLRIPPDLWNAAVAKAAEDGTTVTAVVVAALREYVGEDTSEPA